MKVVFQTRFSFFGQSGWKSQAAADPELLFAPERLDARLRYFEMVTLPSLVAQTDLDFTHMVLSSTLMPAAHQVRLRELVKDTLGGNRARVMFRPEGSAGQFIRSAVHRLYGAETVAQVVLDDDDAVSNDFVAALRAYGGPAYDNPHGQEDYVFVSFPRGYTIGIENDKLAWLEHRYVPYTNLGLALIGPGLTKRNPFMTSHKKIGLRHPSVMVTNLRPYYLRAVHGHNDSNAVKQNRPFRAQDMETAFTYFPFLARYFAMDGPGKVRAVAE